MRGRDLLFSGLLALPIVSGCNCDEQITGLEASLETDPMMIDFGRVPRGSKKDLPLIMRNVGTFQLKIDGYTAGAPFIAPTGTATIAVNDEVEVMVGFLPTELGPVSGTLSITTDDPDLAPLQVPLIGEGIEAAVRVEPASVDFGEVLWNTSTEPSTVEIKVTNPGTDNFDLTALELADDGAGAFTIDVLDAVRTYSPADSDTFTVSYLPNAMGPISGSVRINTTAPAAPEILVPLMGTAVGPQMELCAAAQGETELCTQNGEQPKVDYGFVPRTGSGTGQIRVLNVGDRDLTIFAMQATPDDPEIVVSPDSAGSMNVLIPPGMDSAWTVDFTPDDYLFDSIIVSYASDSATRRSASARVEARIARATIEVQPRGLTFRLGGAADTTRSQVNIFNCGQEALVLSQALTINQTSGPVPAFTLENAPGAGAMIQPQDCTTASPAITFDIVFSTTTNGQYAAEVEIMSNDPVDSTVLVTVAATKT